MIRHSGSSLTYIRPEVWLLFFHFSITAVFTKDLKNVHLCFSQKKVKQARCMLLLFLASALEMRILESHAGRNLLSFISQNIIPKPRTSPRIKSMNGYHDFLFLGIVFEF